MVAQFWLMNFKNINYVYASFLIYDGTVRRSMGSSITRHSTATSALGAGWAVGPSLVGGCSKHFGLQNGLWSSRSLITDTNWCCWLTGSMCSRFKRPRTGSSLERGVLILYSALTHRSAPQARWIGSLFEGVCLVPRFFIELHRFLWNFIDFF